MKIVAKPIKTMVVFEYEGKVPIPYKFKLQFDDGSEQTIYIEKLFGGHDRIPNNKIVLELLNITKTLKLVGS